MSGKDIYEENKRLRSENDLIREQRDNDRLKREQKFDAGLDLLSDALSSFFTGKAQIIVTSGNNPEDQVIYFQMTRGETP